jgi:hypothetical protein
MIARVFSLMMLAVIACPASAAQVTWLLEDVTFEDGGEATGSFVYDDVAGTYLNIKIVTTSVGPFQGFDTAAFPSRVGVQEPTRFTVAGSAADGSQSVLGLFWDVSLVGVNSGTVGITTIPNLSRASVETNGDLSRLVYGGQIRAVPLPAAAWLFGSGLIGLVGVAKRKQS